MSLKSWNPADLRNFNDSDNILLKQKYIHLANHYILNGLICGFATSFVWELAL